jgi:hypothetical protein
MRKIVCIIEGNKVQLTLNFPGSQQTMTHYPTFSDIFPYAIHSRIFHTFFLSVLTVLLKLFGLAKLEEGGRLHQGTKPPPPTFTNPL